MAITLYTNPNFAGDSYRVAGNRASLSSTPVKNSTSSINMTSGSDRALFYKRNDYNGGVMFRSGR